MTPEAKYRRVAVIGHGGMADVHLAVARGPGDFNKVLVLKELRPGFAQYAEHRAMFLHEARVAAHMSHPNVVQTYEVDSVGGRPFIAMEFLDGQPLHRVLRRLHGADGPGLPLHLHLRILAEVLAGLHHAHELCDCDGRPLGLVHRDATPHNVIVTYDGQVKLVDFGIARTQDGAFDTQVGTFKGKASYCAPEQARGEPVDRRADLFAVGVMLWEALARRRMWPELDEVAIVQRLRAGEVPALPADALGGPELRALCSRAVAPEPAQRPATAAVFAEALELHSPGPRASRRQIGALVAHAFADERAELRRLLDAQLRRVRDGREDGAPLVDVVQLSGSDRHAGPVSLAHSLAHPQADAAAPPDEPTRPDGVAAPGRAREETASDAELAVVAADRSRWLPLAGLAAGLVLATGAYMALGTGHEGHVPQDMPATTGECERADRPEVELSGEIEEDARLTCDRRYRLTYTTFVRPGATLTIEAGTTIVGDRDTGGALVVQPGARIVAEGAPDRPIVFTSAAAPGLRRPGDWGGLVVLGRAPTNLPGPGRVEGVARGGEYGGADPDDSSGVLRHVRVEYAGRSLGPNNETNGLTLAGVGRGTRVDHVQVRHPADDCFEFFGGTVDAHHLICQDPGDDGFDWDLGYTGRLQFLLLRSGARAGEARHGGHGIEGDGDPGGSGHAPVSAPQIFNATLCGRGPGRHEHLGLLLRHGTAATVGNLVVAGFDAALDLRDPGTSLALRGALGSALPAGVAQDEAPGGPLPDDDDGLDERASFAAALTIADGAAPGCDAPPLAPRRDAAVRPPDDGFFAVDATYLGALRDAGDDWASAAWTRWD